MTNIWQDQAVDRILARAPLDRPDPAGRQPVGPGGHLRRAGGVRRGQGQPQRPSRARPVAPRPGQRLGRRRSARSTGAATPASGSDQNVMIPFLDQYLKDGPPANIARVTAFEAGTNQWQRLADWPQRLRCAAARPTSRRSTSRRASASASTAPAGRGVRLLRLRPGQAGHLPRPPQPLALGAGLDLAHLAGRRPALRRRPPRRPHLLRPTPLTQPLRLAGTPLVHLVASTSGTDSDWVVKLIDVYPDQYPQKPELGGYQLAIAMDVIRGRYRTDPAHAAAASPANQPRHLRIRAAERRITRVQPGHRLMVQVQSSWFPLYDRNPQTFVPNIFFAKAARLSRRDAARVHRPRGHVDRPAGRQIASPSPLAGEGDSSEA